MSVYVIAEVGPNHNGSEKIAISMIEQLSETGADAVKFQLGTAASVYSKDAFKANYQIRDSGDTSPVEMTNSHQLPAESHPHLADVCRSNGVEYLCTAFDLDSLEYLDKTLNLRAFKIPSGEVLSLDILEYMAKQNRQIFLSTGMCTFDEIEAALRVLETHHPQDITLLHCVSNYPAPHDDIHLRVMNELQERLERPVGYSDHTLGNDCAIAAVARGASVIEKHVTLDRSMEGPDHQASATINDFAELVKSIRVVETALGGTEKIFSDEEMNVRSTARKSITAARNLTPGDFLENTDICFRRPGTGISPMERDSLVGKKVRRPVEKGRLINHEDLA